MGSLAGYGRLARRVGPGQVLLVLGLLGESIQPGVHDRYHGSQSAASSNLDMYIFRDSNTSCWPWYKRKTAVTAAVVLEPMVHALHLPFCLKRVIPIQKKYFFICHACLLQFQLCQSSIFPEMKFYRNENISGLIHGGQVYVFLTPKIDFILFSLVWPGGANSLSTLSLVFPYFAP